MSNQMSHQSFAILRGIRYEQGTVFVMNSYCEECRFIFLFYVQEYDEYHFTHCRSNGTYGTIIFRGDKFMDDVIRINTATEKERIYMKEPIEARLRMEQVHNKNSKNSFWGNHPLTDSEVWIISMLVFFFLFALCPPVAVVLFFLVILLAPSNKKK